MIRGHAFPSGLVLVTAGMAATTDTDIITIMATTITVAASTPIDAAKATLVRHLFNADAAVFKLPAISFEPDRARGWNFHRGFEDLTVAY
jgi:hypothetical protein